MLPGSFWVLEIQYIKKNVEHLQNEAVKEEVFFFYYYFFFLRKFKKHKLNFEPLVLAPL